MAIGDCKTGNRRPTNNLIKNVYKAYFDRKTQRQIVITTNQGLLTLFAKLVLERASWSIRCLLFLCCKNWLVRIKRNINTELTQSESSFKLRILLHGEVPVQFSWNCQKKQPMLQQWILISYWLRRAKQYWQRWPC